ncbi:MAG TPA: hypothetical protein VMP11_10760 [Verrucomicrobiae bacterium]|nr:hypothetical protein [Verrucomicrobiae bacterium]
MDAPRTIWQISGGPSSRSFARLFLDHGVGLLGPGGVGRWTPERKDDDYAGGYVRRFASEVRPGDVILLRKGQSKICAVGLVASEYLFFDQFDDVNGWDLQHGRRVHWCELPQDYDFGNSAFGANPPRLSRINNRMVVDYAERFVSNPPTHWQTAPLPPLPASEPKLGDEEIPGFLQDIIAQARDMWPLMWDRTKYPEHPTEDELIVHFVVPVLRALGWHPEQIAIKWRFIDVTVFKALPRTPENSAFVIEVKRLGAGVEGALPQGKRYVEALGVPRDVLVTDGIRYRVYDCATGHEPAAYANLINLKKSALCLFTRIKRP